MSGGSYEYLCYKSPEELLVRQDLLIQMADRLAELGHKEASQATWTVIMTIRKAYSVIEHHSLKLNGIWKAVEWCDSGDSTANMVEESVKEWLEIDKANMINCANCKFFAYRTVSDTAGECRLNPPVAIPVPTQFGIKMQSGWPPTLPESCCGQGIARDESNSLHIDKEVASRNGAETSKILV